MSEFVNRREEPRYEVNRDTSCAFAMPVSDDLGDAKIKNISMAGIGLQVERAVAKGTILTIGLSNENREFMKTVLVEVVHCTQQLGGGYLVGGVFLTPLSYKEMSMLVL